MHREVIVGQRIRSVHRSPEQIDDDGYGGCAVYVELANGPLFELEFIDLEEGETASLTQLERPLLLRRVEKCVKEACEGQRIEEVVVSELWASIGLLLENGVILTTGESGLKFVGAVVHETHSDDWRASEYKPLWPSDS